MQDSYRETIIKFPNKNLLKQEYTVSKIASTTLSMPMDVIHVQSHMVLYLSVLKNFTCFIFIVCMKNILLIFQGKLQFKQFPPMIPLVGLG